MRSHRRPRHRRSDGRPTSVGPHRAGRRNRAASAVPDAANRERALLLALELAIERRAAFAEVVEQRGPRRTCGRGPIEAVRIEIVVLAVEIATTAQDGFEAGAPTAQERVVSRAAAVLGIVEDAAEVARELAPLLVRRQTRPIAECQT